MKRNTIAILALFAGLGLSAFTNHSKFSGNGPHKGFFTNYYFKYKNTVSFTGASYMTASNWEARGFNPGADDCPEGADEKVCVLSASLPWGNSQVSHLMAFFNDMGGASNVANYVEDIDHIYYYQPGP
jgi:hypothetical protein